MPYLICDKCNVSYEIINRDEMNDFHVCKCGNELKYYETIEEYMNEGPVDLNVDADDSKTDYFYTRNKKDILTLEMEILRDHEEAEKQTRLKREHNYEINHAIAEQNEKMSNRSKYEPLIVKEFGDKSLKKKKELLLREMELLKESRDQ